MSKIRLKVREPCRVRLEIRKETAVQLHVEQVRQVGPGALPYEGPYTVTPALYDPCILETQGFRMTDDVTVEPIPIRSVSNPQGGRTVTIGSY